MTKDAQKLLRHIIDRAKSQNSATVEIDISKIDNIPNIGFAQKKLLNELETAGIISGYQANILGEVFVYLTSDGLEYFDDLREDRESSNMVFNVSGGQVNIANDNGKMETIQKIGVEGVRNAFRKVHFEDINRLILYRSSVVLKEIFNTSNMENVILNLNRFEINKTLSSDMSVGEIYKFQGMFILKEVKKKRFSTQIEVSSAENLEYRVTGTTSFDNWVSESYLNNLLAVSNGYLFEGILKVLNISKKIFTVQYIIIGEKGVLNG